MTTATDQPTEPTQLLALLQQQCDGYQQLVDLGCEQSRLIEAGQPEQLLALLSRRQSLIDRLGELGRQVGECRRRWPDLAAALGGESAQSARRMLRQVEQLLSQIIAQDEQDRSRLAAAHQRTGGQLRQAAAAPRAIGAYRAAAAQSPRFTDRKG